MKYRILLVFLFLGQMQMAAHSQITYDTYFTEQVLRIDYFRSGNAMNEEIALQTFHVEDFWSGCRSKTTEPYDYGDYKIEVFSEETKQKLFSFSYSGLFAEFTFTETGQTEIKTFQETVRMPFPKVPVQIVFYKRKFKDNLWEQQFELIVDPATVNITETPEISGRNISQIHFSGLPEKHVDIAVVAEGYTADQSEKFFRDATKTANDILNCEPFSFHKEKFNFWAVFVPSDEDGVTDPSGDIAKSTILNCNFSTFGTDRYLMTEDHFVLRDVVSSVPYDHLIILVNVNKYGGGGIYNFYATSSSDDLNSDFLVVHEFGHSFAGLADEYWTSDVSVIDYYNFEVEPCEPNITTLVSFESKWKELLEDGVPVPTPDTKEFRNKVGVFEGGGYVEKGIYRPFYDCTMKSVKYNAFCPVCQKAIEKAMMHYFE